MSKEHKIEEAIFSDETAMEFGKLLGAISKLCATRMFESEEQRLKRQIKMLEIENDLLRKGYNV